MNLPLEKWQDTLQKRHSTRSYNAEPLAEDKIAALHDFFTHFLSPPIRATLITEGVDKIFRGVIGRYGKVKGAPACIAFITDTTAPHHQEKTGYYGEAAILECTALNLATCWVGGLFDRAAAGRHMELAPGERIFAVTPVGYPADAMTFDERLMKGLAKSHTRKELSQLCTGMSPDKWPGWVKSALEAVRCAPSALNRQPWRFLVEEKSITLSLDNDKDSPFLSKLLDCGIAMLHIEVGAGSHGVRGTWEYLTFPSVACYRV